MTKWGNYAIVKSKYDSKHERIVEVKIRKVDDKLGPENPVTRQWVVQQIENKVVFVTATETTQGNWKVGEEVQIVVINGTKFIKTEPDNELRDNLGELPEF